MIENGKKSIVFPATNVAGEAKLKRLLDTIADYMGTKVTVESVIVMQVSFPSDRPDVEAIFKRLAGSKTGLNQVGRTIAPEATKNSATPSEPEAEKGE